MLKTLESVLCEKTVNHLEVNKLTMIEQHGFRHKRSCQAKLISLLDEATCKIDTGEKVEGGVAEGFGFRETQAS